MKINIEIKGLIEALNTNMEMVTNELRELKQIHRNEQLDTNPTATTARIQAQEEKIITIETKVAKLYELLVHDQPNGKKPKLTFFGRQIQKRLD